MVQYMDLKSDTCSIFKNPRVVQTPEFDARVVQTPGNGSAGVTLEPTFVPLAVIF
jgi:hypothetical protein